MKLTLKFKTSRALSQEEGMTCWGLGSHFVSLTGSGGCTYQLITEPKMVSDSIAATIDAAHAALAAALPEVDVIVLIGASAELVPAEMPTHTTTLIPAGG